MATSARSDLEEQTALMLVQTLLLARVGVLVLMLAQMLVLKRVQTLGLMLGLAQVQLLVPILMQIHQLHQGC